MNLYCKTWIEKTNKIPSNKNTLINQGNEVWKKVIKNKRSNLINILNSSELKNSYFLMNKNVLVLSTYGISQLATKKVANFLQEKLQTVINDINVLQTTQTSLLNSSLSEHIRVQRQQLIATKNDVSKKIKANRLHAAAQRRYIQKKKAGLIVSIAGKKGRRRIVDNLPSVVQEAVQGSGYQSKELRLVVPVLICP